MCAQHWIEFEIHDRFNTYYGLNWAVWLRREREKEGEWNKQKRICTTRALYLMSVCQGSDWLSHSTALLQRGFLKSKVSLLWQSTAARNLKAKRFERVLYLNLMQTLLYIWFNWFQNRVLLIRVRITHIHHFVSQLSINNTIHAHASLSFRAIQRHTWKYSNANGSSSNFVYFLSP